MLLTNRWYAGLAIGAIGKHVEVGAGMARTNRMRFEVTRHFEHQPCNRKDKHLQQLLFVENCHSKENDPDSTFQLDFQ